MGVGSPRWLYAMYPKVSKTFDIDSSGAHIRVLWRQWCKSGDLVECVFLFLLLDRLPQRTYLAFTTVENVTSVIITKV